MKRRSLFDRSLLALALLVLAGPARAEPDAAKLFADNCAECHGADRLGRLGPALLPENLGRMMGARSGMKSIDANPSRRRVASPVVHTPGASVPGRPSRPLT